MNINYIGPLYIDIDINCIIPILEFAKVPTTEYITIPRIVTQDSIYTSIIGSNNNSIININQFDEIILKFEQPLVLWSEPAIPCISFIANQIPPFLKAIKDNGISKIRMEYVLYHVNGMPSGIAVNMFVDEIVKMKNSQGELDWKPCIKMISHYDIVPFIETIYNKFENSRQIYTLTLDNNTEFRDIWNLKSSDGCKIWVPNMDIYPDTIKPYIMYLSKSAFAVSKSDMVTLTIRDTIPGEIYDKFIVRFEVTKKIRKGIFSRHNYYMICMLIGN